MMVKRLIQSATVPTKGSRDSAGWDLYSCQYVKIPAFSRGLVSTGISVLLAPGTYGRIASRSGLSVKSGIEVGAGVVDPDYRGDIKVLLYNHGNTEYEVHIGDRVAQMVVTMFSNEPIYIVDEIDNTVRGARGFGSTGK